MLLLRSFARSWAARPFPLVDALAAVLFVASAVLFYSGSKDLLGDPDKPFPFFFFLDSEAIGVVADAAAEAVVEVAEESELASLFEDSDAAAGTMADAAAEGAAGFAEMANGGGGGSVGDLDGLPGGVPLEPELPSAASAMVQALVAGAAGVAGHWRSGAAVGLAVWAAVCLNLSLLRRAFEPALRLGIALSWAVPAAAIAVGGALHFKESLLHAKGTGGGGGDGDGGDGGSDDSAGGKQAVKMLQLGAAAAVLLVALVLSRALAAILHKLHFTIEVGR